MMLFDILSAGKICETIQLLPDEVIALADELGVKVAAKINGVTHYDATDVQAMRDVAWERRRRRTKELGDQADTADVKRDELDEKYPATDGDE